MTRPLALLALLLLAACQGGVWANVPTDDTPDGRECRREAESDPEVRRIARSATMGMNPSHDEQIRQELLAALPRAWRACMTRRGAIPAGGVEPVQRVRF